MGGKVHICVYRILVGKPKERDGFGYLNVHGKIILKWILKKQDGKE